MPDLALRRLRPVFDLGKQPGLDPDALVRDPLGVGLCLPDQRLEALLQVGRGGLVETVVDLAGVDQVIALAAPEVVDAVPFALFEREAGDGQGLALRAGLLDPVVATAAA